MDNIKEELLKELLRFKEIGRNSDNLTEQLIGGGSGFVDDQGQSNTLTKFSSRQKEPKKKLILILTTQHLKILQNLTLQTLLLNKMR